MHTPQKDQQFAERKKILYIEPLENAHLHKYVSIFPSAPIFVRCFRWIILIPFGGLDSQFNKRT